MPVELLYADRFLRDEAFALEYAKNTVSDITSKMVESVEFLLNKRVIKVNTVLSLDGFRVCITGKASGGKKIGIQNLMQFKTSPANERYIKRLESFSEKKKKNLNIVFSEQFDGITAEQNIALYDAYIDKLQNTVFEHRPTSPLETLLKGREKFVALSPEEQVPLLLAILGLFGRVIKADLEKIGGAKGTGEMALSSSISNWKKNYTDVRIIDMSASGLYENISPDNLLDFV